MSYFGKRGARDYYAVLGVSRDASDHEIKSAFRILSFKYHPDKQRTPSQSGHETFVRIREAYETLIDPARRPEHDRQLPPQTQPEPKKPQKDAKQTKKQKEGKGPQRDHRQYQSMPNLLDLEIPINDLWDVCRLFRNSNIPFPPTHTFEKLHRAIQDVSNAWFSLKINIELAKRSTSTRDYHVINLISQHAVLHTRITATKAETWDILFTHYASKRFDAIPSVKAFWEDELRKTMGRYLYWYFFS